MLVASWGCIGAISAPPSQWPPLQGRSWRPFGLGCSPPYPLIECWGLLRALLWPSCSQRWAGVEKLAGVRRATEAERNEVIKAQ
eukprot:3380141-Pyramimonas_sp.AAC.1